MRLPFFRLRMSATAAAAVLGLAALPSARPAAAELFVWVDAEGRTHVTDDSARVPDPQSAARAGDAQLGSLWSGRIEGPQPVGGEASGSADDARVNRLLRGAVDDLQRGETARATATLEGVLRLEPGRPEAHWYLALLDRQRGRFDSARAHLAAFLAHAGDDLDTWRASAERRLAGLDDENRLAERRTAAGPLRLVAVASPHFRVHYDAQLGDASPDYAETVVRYLEEAWEYARSRLGIAPVEPTGVVLYGRAAYLAAHSHRFSFPTVGFYDGRIHVSSAAHPAGELRALLFHEYTHAIFAERTGGHRPFWLNEGLAELAERGSRLQEPLTRSERSLLRRHIEANEWIPLRRIAAGFGRLDETSARLAYLESMAAAEWLTGQTTAEQRRTLLDRLGEGASVDVALRELLDTDTDGLDLALRQSIRVFFPAAGVESGR